MKDNYDEKLEMMLEEKISEMEAKDYVFPDRFSQKDYMVTGILVLACLICVILGAKM